MSEGTAARVYAEAMFEVADARGMIDAVERDLDELLRVLEEHPDLEALLISPRVRATDKHRLLEQVFADAKPEILNFLRLLIDHGRFGLLRTISASHGELTDKALGRVHVHVTSAQPLTDEESRRVRAAVKAEHGGQVVMHLRVDPSLLGGIVIRAGDRVVDGSVRTRLRTIQRLMHEAKGVGALWESDVDSMIEDVRKAVANVTGG